MAIDLQDPEYVRALGKRIEAAREGLSAAEFAAAIGVHKNTLSRYEHGARMPDARVIARICEVRNISPTWLLLGTGSMRLSDEEASDGQAYQLGEPGAIYRTLSHEKNRELLLATTGAIRRAEYELGYEIPATWASLMNSLVFLYGMHPEGITRVAELLKASQEQSKGSAGRSAG